MKQSQKDQVVALALQMMGLASGSSADVQLAAYVTSLLTFAQRTPLCRDAMVWQLRTLAEMVQELGQATGEELDALVSAQAALLAAPDGAVH